MSRFWQRMAALYGHRWSSSMGDVLDAKGKLSSAAKVWQQGLKGLTLAQLGSGFEALATSDFFWPPSLPEFRALCVGRGGDNVPSLDQVVAILTTTSRKQGSLVDRFYHPLCLAIAQRVDMHTLRTAKQSDAKREIKAHYSALLQQGWENWPDGAEVNRALISRNIKPADKAVVKRAFTGIRSLLN